MATATQHQRAALSATAVARLADLPVEVIERVLCAAGLSPSDLAAANAASRVFRGTPGGRSPVEHALRERARARGHAHALLPTELPAGVCSWTEELFARERVLVLVCAHASTVVAGAGFSAFVDAEGGLHTCGEEAVWDEDTGEPTDDYLAHVALGHCGVSAVSRPSRVASLSAVHVVAVAAGWAHLLALSDAGAVYGCGHNECGQLGLGHTQTRRSFALVAVSHGTPAVGVTAGHCHSLALTAAGCAYSWGHNYHGQLGHGDTEDRLEPTRIEALDGVRVGGLAAGGTHTLLVSIDGAVHSCGEGRNGRLGHGDKLQRHTPRRIEALAGARAVHASAGFGHCLVVDAAGAVHAFGEGSNGELGHCDYSRRLAPARIEALAGMRAVRACAGFECSAVLGANGSVRTFGDNEYGQLGVRTSAVQFAAPSRIQALLPECITGCASGLMHALFVTAGGRVYSAGQPCAALGQGVSTADAEDQLPPGLRRRGGSPMLIDALPRVLACADDRWGRGAQGGRKSGGDFYFRFAFPARA